MLTSSEGGMTTNDRLQLTDYFEVRRRRGQDGIELSQAPSPDKNISYGGTCYQDSPKNGWICSRDTGHDGDHHAVQDGERVVAIWYNENEKPGGEKPENQKPKLYTIDDRWEYPVQGDQKFFPTWPGQYDDMERMCGATSPNQGYACTKGYGCQGSPHVFKPSASERVYACWDTPAE